ncbi:hypothetical protein BKA70DRAFT_1222432 [Coprinopsis sp. MPI-PUGE-AT-0042]|nr:hypothetical protein BKA70DRAFT_1222432 [Coprinopsis sp. MPI-PUGE-AT-0042]
MSKVTQDDVILLLRTSYAGILLMTFGQTYQLFLCIQTLRQARKTPRQLAKSRRPYIAIMIVIMSLSVLAFVVDMLDKGAIFTTGMAITPDTEFPPDPLWWHIAAPLAIGGTHFAGDGLLIWRTYILWNAHSHIWCLSIVPYIGSFGTLVAYTAISSKWALTEEESGLPLVIKLLTAYYISSISVNVIATTLICFRLLSFKRKMEKTLGAYRLTSEIPYLRIASILIESALPFTIFGVACAVSSALFENLEISTQTHAIYHITWPLWVVSSALAPQLIIARVLNGRSWAHDPTHRLDEMVMTLEFAAAPNPNQTNSGEAESVKPVSHDRLSFQSSTAAPD